MATRCEVVRKYYPQLESLEIRNLLAPSMLDPNLDVRMVTDGLTTPTALAFLGRNDFLIAEKNTGRVRRVTNGQLGDTVLDLNVNFGSERGLLGMALHPFFPAIPSVYLFWTASSTPQDTNVLSETQFLGNRVDRFTWDGTRLRFEQNIVHIRAIQTDVGQNERGNHDGGVIAFGPDLRLYVIVGDLGRRGLMQNNTLGPFPDDQYGGPEPDTGHLTGVILRLNPDGSTPDDNPFYAYGQQIGGDVGASIAKVYAYGIRNSFGLAFDPYTGFLWNQENADDAFDEINLIFPGQNNGWVNIMGPVERIAEFKSIEVNEFGGQMQQLRWPPTRIAETPAEALDRLYLLPGAYYRDPAFSWKYAVPPSAIGFQVGDALGKEYTGNLFAGAATLNTMGGYLMRFRLDKDRVGLHFDDPRLADLVADNATKHDPTESEELFIGRDFGITGDIETGPNGNLYVGSISDGAVYEVFRRPVSPLLGRAAAELSALVPFLMSRNLTSLAPLAPPAELPREMVPPVAAAVVDAPRPIETPPGIFVAFTATRMVQRSDLLPADEFLAWTV